MSNIFNLSNIFTESTSHDMIRDKFYDESYLYTAMTELKDFQRSFMENTIGLYKSIYEAENSSKENQIFCQYFTDIDNKINDIINKVNETLSRFTINVENIVDANRDIIDNTSVITRCKPFVYSYTKYEKINDKNFPPINAIGIFKEEFDYIAQLLQELGPTASNQSKLKVIATVYNKLVKSDIDINKKCIESILGECEDSEDVAEFPEHLYEEFKSSEKEDIEITKGKLYEIKMSFDNYQGIIDSCSESASRLVSQLCSISDEIKRIICGNDKTTYTVDTTTDGIRNTDYKMDTYGMNQLNIFLKAKLNQVVQICNIYYIAIAIKLDATMEYFKQCKDILTFAMANTKEDIQSDAAEDAQNDVDDDGKLQIDDTLEDNDDSSDDNEDEDSDDDNEDTNDDSEDEPESDDSEDNLTIDSNDDSSDDDDNGEDTSTSDDDDSDYSLEDMNMDSDQSSSEDNTTDGDSLNDLDEALNNFKEACMSMDYKEYCSDMLYEYTEMLETLVSITEEGEDNKGNDTGNNDNQNANDNTAKGDLKTATSKAGVNNNKTGIVGKIKEMINKLINLIRDKFRKNFEEKYKQKIEMFKQNEKYIKMEPISYQNEDGTPVTDFDVNLDAFNNLAIPRFDANTVKNIKDKDDFIKNELKVDIIKDGDNTLSIAQSIERKVLTKPSRVKNFNELKLMDIYNWCINYDKVVSDTEELGKLLEQGAKNAEAMAKTLTESSGQFSLRDTMLDYFSEFSAKTPENNGDNNNGSGDNDFTEKVQIYFNCCKDVISAKMSIAQMIFTEWSKILEYQINNRKSNDVNVSKNDNDNK